MVGSVRYLEIDHFPYPFRDILTQTWAKFTGGAENQVSEVSWLTRLTFLLVQVQIVA